MLKKTSLTVLAVIALALQVGSAPGSPQAAPAIGYSTYFGGENADSINDIAVDTYGNIYVVGETDSSKLKLQHPALQFSQISSQQPGDAFVAKFTPDGAHLIYSTYLGGNRADRGMAIAVDAGGFAYVTGTTKSQSFPTKFPLQRHKGGASDAFVAKISPGGTFVYSTFLGGTGNDQGRAIRVDSEGNTYVVGMTGSPDFPVTAGAIGVPVGDSIALNAFVTKIDPTGSAILYSRTIGGSNTDEALAAAIDNAGAIYITGVTQSSDFPVLSPFQAGYGDGDILARAGDAFVTKLDSDGALLYSTFLGGSNGDAGTGIAVATDGSVFVTGQTLSTDFPTSHGSQTDPDLDPATGYDVFVTALDPTGSSLRYSTYFGGSGLDFACDIAVGRDDAAYVTGVTYSPGLATPNAPQQTLAGERDAFLCALDNAGMVVFATYLGGQADDGGTSVVVGPDRAVYIAGSTASSNFPTANAFQARRRKLFADGFITKLDLGS